MPQVIVLTGNRETAYQAEWSGTSHLKELQQAVDGRIQMLAMGTGWECYVNEEGKLHDKFHQNESAAYILEAIGHQFPNMWECLIYGPAVLLFKSKTSKAYKKASEWFEKYKADQLDSEDSQD